MNVDFCRVQTAISRALPPQVSVAGAPAGPAGPAAVLSLPALPRIRPSSGDRGNPRLPVHRQKGPPQHPGGKNKGLEEAVSKAREVVAMFSHRVQVGGGAPALRLYIPGRARPVRAGADQPGGGPDRVQQRRPASTAGPRRPQQLQHGDRPARLPRPGRLGPRPARLALRHQPPAGRSDQVKVRPDPACSPTKSSA